CLPWRQLCRFPGGRVGARRDAARAPRRAAARAPLAAQTSYRRRWARRAASARAGQGGTMPIERFAADVVVRNAFVRTLDAQDAAVQAVAIRGDRIVGLGTDAEMESLTDTRTRVLDAGGRTVLPAFIDTHSHLNDAALTREYRVDYET